MVECTCSLLPREEWYTHYGTPEPGSMYEPNPDCPEHFRKPPFRLADGGWSDGVDRDDLIREAYRTYENGTVRWAVVKYYDEWHAGQLTGTRTFPTHAEAIAYADRAARAKQ